MKQKMFTVYDSKAEAYLQPFFMTTKGQAIRSFSEIANDKNHQFGKYPSDFTLYEIGEYDDQSAEINMLQNKIPLGTALEFQSRSENVPQIQSH